MQRLYELDRENFEVTPTKTEQCTLIEITAFKGRSLEAKKNLYKEIINNLKIDFGIDCNDIVIVINEPPLENWGVRGGNPANEVNLGFKTEV